MEMQGRKNKGRNLGDGMGPKEGQSLLPNLPTSNVNKDQASLPSPIFIPSLPSAPLLPSALCPLALLCPLIFSSIGKRNTYFTYYSYYGKWNIALCIILVHIPLTVYDTSKKK